MASTHRIRIDPGLLLSIARNCNGANAHMVREYAHAYEMACFLGVEEQMNRALRQLQSELIKAEYLRSENGRTFAAQAEENVRVI